MQNSGVFCLSYGKINIGTVYSKRFYYVSIQALSHDQQVIFWTTWRFSEVTIKSSYSVVTFSVFVLCDVIVFMELPNSYIFKGTLEIYHSEWKSVTKWICAKIWPAWFKIQNNLKEKWEFTVNGWNFCCSVGLVLT